MNTTGSTNESQIEKATAWFVRMQSDKVTPADHRAFRKWLKEDPRNQGAYREVKTLWEKLGKMPAHAPPPVDSPPTPTPYPSASAVSSQASRLLVLAASLVLTLGLWWQGPRYLDQMLADQSTGFGDIRIVNLPDGSKIHLNSDTAYRMDFNGQHRGIILDRGEAFFEVVKNPGKPFEVVAGQTLTRVTGTKFNVRRSDAGVTVSVVSGTVLVIPNEQLNEGPKPVLLKAGQATHYNRENPVLASKPFKVEEVVSWQQKKLVFTDQPLGKVIDELNRHRAGTILLMDSSLREVPFTGVFDLNHPDSALEVIEAALPVTIHQATRYLILIRPAS
ncbi:MAG: DUF4880 domain-containing protein [Candidatus Nitronauta litoralis]|uniref:DUF4880 domain-containing protein n=1 Tax=Candidatus Nitronauta litoralis TaxID=2705533 RepID=A0A7T0BZ48_9BACT|nr:MAG: DUF4880 domain-containing protein [Candidatus Nitronauta litoralis]